MVKMGNGFDVVINTDDNYIQHCMAMLCSLYENNKEYDIVLHVVTKSLSDQNQNFISDLTRKYGNKCYYYIVDESSLDGVQFRKQRPLSKAAYYRLLLSSILPQTLDKVLYLDCDIIVLRDISEVFQIELDDYALAASIDDFPYTPQHRLQLSMEADERTFCSGVMMINLKYWRKYDSETKLLEYAKCYRKEIHLHDQDVLNYVFKKKWFLLPPKWNRIPYSLLVAGNVRFQSFDMDEYLHNPMLLHYASLNLKPWYNIYTYKRHYYRDYLKKSGYAPIKFDKVSWKIRMLAYRSQFGLIIRLYLEPCAPRIVKIILEDLKDVIRGFIKLFSIKR